MALFKRKHIPDISVIIPVYNVEDFLADCIESVLKLEKKADIEVLLIDDGSTDRSVEIARDYAKKNKSVELYLNKHGGPGACRNFGVDHSKGRYILFVDSDDMIFPDTFIDMFYLAEKTDCDFCVCRHLRVKDGQNIISGLSNKMYYCLDRTVTGYEEHPNFVFDVLSWNKLIRRSFYEKNGIRYPENTFYEDYPTVLRMYAGAERISVCWKAGSMWRIRTGGSKSITQGGIEDKTVDDKFNMLERCMDISMDTNLSSSMKREIHAKLFTDVLNSFMFRPEGIDDEDPRIRELIHRTKEFIDKYEVGSLLEHMPAIYEKIYQAVIDEDAKGILRCVEYFKSGYNDAPFIYGDEGVKMRLPDNIESERKYDVHNEIRQTQPTVQVTGLDVREDGICFRGHVFRKRVQTSNEYPQYIEAKVLSSFSNESIVFPADPEMTGYITENYGKRFDSGIEGAHGYDYDLSGFSFTIDPGQIDENPAFDGDSPILIYHRTALEEGIQMLGGLSSDVKGALNTPVRLGKSEISVRIDGSGAFFIRKRRFKQ